MNRNTKFSAAHFLPSESTTSSWETFTKMWANAYVGHPDILAFDQGSQSTSIEWESLMMKYGIKSQRSGVERHNALGVGERYHDYLRKVYNRIYADTPSTRPELALSIAVKVCNDTAGINGLSPTLLIFGIVPRLPLNQKELPIQLERVKAIRAARREMSGLIPTDCIKMALARDVPSAADAVLNEGAEVLMYREKPIAEWMGPYIIHKRDDKMLTLDTGNQYIEASIDKAKPYYSRRSNIDTQTTEDTKTNPDDEVSQLLDQFMPRHDGSPSDQMLSVNELVVKIIKPQDDRSKEKDFANAKRMEVEGLIKRNIWTGCKIGDSSPD